MPSPEPELQVALQQELGAIGRQDRHPIAALQAALQEPAGDGAAQAEEIA